MSKPMVLEIDVQTGIETVREMTDAEYATMLESNLRVDEEGNEINPDLVV